MIVFRLLGFIIGAVFISQVFMALFDGMGLVDVLTYWAQRTCLLTGALFLAFGISGHRWWSGDGATGGGTLLLRVPAILVGGFMLWEFVEPLTLGIPVAEVVTFLPSIGSLLSGCLLLVFGMVGRRAGSAPAAAR